jgi:hypothetical protein
MVRPGNSAVFGTMAGHRAGDGSWGIPINLGPEINRAAYQIEAKLSPDHRRLYFSCPFVPKPADIPSKQEDRQRALDHSEWETGLDNIWFVSLDRWLEGR